MKINHLVKAKEVLIPSLDKSIAPKAARNIFLFIKAVEKEEEFVQSEMKKYCEEYGEKKDNGSFVTNEQGFIQIKEDCVEQFNDKVKKLENLEVQISNTLSMDDLAELKFSVRQMVILDEVIKEG